MDERLAALDRSLLLFEELVVGTPSEVSDALAFLRVEIRVSPDEAALSHAQAAVATLASLLARTGISVEATLPSVVVLTPLLTGTDLGTALAALVTNSFPGAELRSASALPSLVISIGELEPVRGSRNLWLYAEGQAAGFRSEPAGFDPADALVALAAAGMVAGEATRQALRALPSVSATAARELAAIERAGVEIPAIPAGLIDLGKWDCISAGAITHSMLWAFAARGQVEGDLRVFDDGRYEITNLNRYMLLSLLDAKAEVGKANHLADLRLAGLRLTGVSRRFALEDVSSARSQIMIGADDIRVRHIAQRANPDYLAIGATSHFEVRITQHVPGGPCASCAHPYYNETDDGLIPTLATVSFWAGLWLALFVLAKASGEPVPAERSYLTFWPLRPGTGLAGAVRWHPYCRLGHGAATDAA